MNAAEYLRRRRRQVERFLERCLPASAVPDRLNEAMRYSLLSGGKRLRPVLALAACDAVGGNPAVVLPFAGALELIHTYSLIHDDLPAMDNDALRRGKPTSHLVFGEALAILAGDALLTEAFRIMVEAAKRPGHVQPRALQVIAEIAVAAGARGMVAGQAADMDAEGTSVGLPAVEMIHVRKTGALIRAAVRAGGLLGGASSTSLRRLTRYAEYLGLAFQVADDILDAEGSVARTGKRPGGDEKRRKATFATVLGLPAARGRARELLGEALDELDPFDGGAEPLRELARFAVGRACPS